MSTFLLPLGLVHSSGRGGAGACALPRACDVRPTAHDSTTPDQTTPHDHSICDTRRAHLRRLVAHSRWTDKRRLLLALARTIA